MQTGDTPYTRLPPANAAASPLHRRPSVLALAGAVAISCGLLGSVAVRRSAPGGELDLRSGRERLRFVNGCQKDDIWLAGTAVAVPLFTPDVKLGAGEEYAFTVPDAGLASTRFWPKWGCNEAGQMCAIGQSGGPGEACAPEGCAPPVDSKFEATFGCKLEPSRCARNPSAPDQPIGAVDWWDVSQVDGWTLPYKVEVSGDCPQSPSVIDCSTLALSQCPDKEDLGPAHGEQDLQLHALHNKTQVVGCYSPCGKLSFGQWGQGYGHAPQSEEARDFCCPTPPVQPEACSSGPVARALYTEAVHRLCPSVYAFAYDDGVGLAQCPAGVEYKVTFYCPR